MHHLRNFAHAMAHEGPLGAAVIITAVIGLPWIVAIQIWGVSQ